MTGLSEHVHRKDDAHNHYWADLPVFPAGMEFSDDDAEAWGDILYMRGLVDSIEDIQVQLLARIADAPTTSDLAWVVYLQRSARAWLPVSLEFSEPWPEDEAAKLLAAWRES
jgi:hypothetical protein